MRPARIAAALGAAFTAQRSQASGHHDPAFRQGRWSGLFADATAAVEHEAGRVVEGFNYLLETARPAILTLASISMLIIFAAGFARQLRAPAIIAACAAVWLICASVLVADFFIG